MSESMLYWKGNMVEKKYLINIFPSEVDIDYTMVASS